MTVSEFDTNTFFLKFQIMKIDHFLGQFTTWSRHIRKTNCVKRIWQNFKGGKMWKHGNPLVFFYLYKTIP